MAAELVGGALLSSMFQSAIDRLASPEVVDYLRGNNISDDLIYELKIVLLVVNAVLDDAEGKQITNINVKKWLNELEVASYEADDLLDQIATDALQSDLEASGSRKSKKSMGGIGKTTLAQLVYNDHAVEKHFDLKLWVCLSEECDICKLKDEDCWKIFQKHAFDKIRGSSVCQVLEKIGRGIVKKCKGLPIAAKTLGGLLHSKEDVSDWERVLQSEIWDFSHKESKILPVLLLSYNYLPSHLKQCFAFCSTFPKDYEFKKHELVLLWMAENLLRQANINKRVEDIGNEYFDELVYRSFFQRSSSRQESCFVMHDLIYDVARFVSR
ncbi:putative disease resistance RPP13-like protein 1 [Ziziphus jujuba]|uniref:Disease resistance RPP13-like protein 1 n=1 Tax=Ziziphus jujuba TaxID=326968 RepID=A0ABM3ZYF2_ZIZJJ|nr:putative disease resistance RPP13-like protein 1 [Ziziphus jujuba]